MKNDTNEYIYIYEIYTIRMKCNAYLHVCNTQNYMINGTLHK